MNGLANSPYIRNFETKDIDKKDFPNDFEIPVADV
jgi:hypothetical protein